VRSDAVNSRFHGVRHRADLHDQHQLIWNTVLVVLAVLILLDCIPRPRGIHRGYPAKWHSSSPHEPTAKTTALQRRKRQGAAARPEKLTPSRELSPARELSLPDPAAPAVRS
jgi:uncharacterized protein (DUF924 family)